MNTTSKKNGVIIAASKVELMNKAYQRRLWIAVRNTPYSRRDWKNKLAETLYSYEGVILTSEGIRFPLPDVDYVMGDDDGRWISIYKEEVNGSPKRQTRSIERLRMFDLFFKIAKPNIARHFGK